MTHKWHRLTSMALGACLTIAVYARELPNPYPYLRLEMVGALFMLGIIIGSSAPDWMEKISARPGRWHVSIPLFPHRTLTHWSPLWIAALFEIWSAAWPWSLRMFALGFVISGLFHVLMDAFSVQGVPAIHSPMGRYRMKFPLYTTGRLSEPFWGMAVIAAMISSLVWFTRG